MTTAPSTLHFLDFSKEDTTSVGTKLAALVHRAGLMEVVAPRDRVAVKVHWGERGNEGYLPVPYVRAVCDMIKEAGGRPFVTDTNVLYKGGRQDALGNLETAAMHGFTPEALGCPVIIADGLVGKDYVEVPVEGEIFQSARIASAIARADAIVVLSHIKGHILFGMGGALKNLGMGAAVPSAKQVLHSDLKPQVDHDGCVGCGVCVRHCPTAAITLGKTAAGVKATIDHASCIGCADCIVTCPERAIPELWGTGGSPARLFQKTAEYAYAATLGKEDKVAYLSFILKVTPDCDCAGWTDPPIVPDLGILAGTDGVAIDAAAMDMVNHAPALPGSRIYTHGPTDDKLALLTKLDYREILRHAEKIGMGRAAYRLVTS